MPTGLPRPQRPLSELTSLLVRIWITRLRLWLVRVGVRLRR
jgi:hypothetical protein